MKVFVVNNRSPGEQIGGSEIQCWLIAKYLAAKGHQTAYIALQGLISKKKEKGEGFNVYYLIKKGDNKLNIFIEFYWLLKKEKPDICYIRIFRYLFFLAKICKFLKIPVVFNTSHINDCKPDLEKVRFDLNPLKVLKLIRIVIQRRLNFSTLRKVKVVTINKYHAGLLKEKYGITALPIYNSMEDNYEKNKVKKDQAYKKKKQIVCVNQIKARKRPELFIKLVNEFKNSNYKFLMIGKIEVNKDYYKKLIRKCEKENPNFKYLGEKTPEEVDKILVVSETLINTCEPEGFGNNFIQAWFNECPAITLSFDPDDIMKTNKIGFHSKTFEQMVKDLKYLMEHEKERIEMGRRAREYALKNHDINKNVLKYESYFNKIKDIEGN